MRVGMAHSILLKKPNGGKKTMNRLERHVGKEKSVKIMESCGRRCCGSTTRNHVKKIAEESSSVKDFLEKLNRAGIGGGRLILKDKKTIMGGYDHCYCGQVKQTIVPFPTTTYCHCSVGWYTQLFESALGKSVDVEIVQSIVMGAPRYEFVIHI
jgi:hypothetical protein